MASDRYRTAPVRSSRAQQGGDPPRPRIDRVNSERRARTVHDFLVANGVDSAITTGMGRELQTDKSWVDPILGIGWRPSLGKRWTLGTRFDIGGFGVGSKLTWMAEATIDWQVGKFIALGAGYRALDVDYQEESEDFAYAVRHHGPAGYLRFFW